MYLPDLSTMLDRRSMITTPTPIDKSHFTLDTSGVSGFFGGSEAISAMATVHVYRGRRWLGWYNTPGSYQIAKQYGLIAKSTHFKGFFPGVRTDPAKLFDFDGWQGPKFRGTSSGTIIESTGHLASILMKHCESMEGTEIKGRKGPGVGVTIVKLNKVPDEEVVPVHAKDYSTFSALIPIIVSLAACIASGVYRDWYSCWLILWGILSNGISCLVIGLGTLRFKHHIPAKGCPPGDGILGGSAQEFVLLQGQEGAVNSITLGKFSIEFPSKSYYEYIGYCSILLSIQFIAQLFLIPQGSLFGQIMFISSLAVSWIYNSCVAAIDKEKIQQDILLDEVLGKPKMKKYLVTTRASALVLALYSLHPANPAKVLEAYLPNDTKVWGKWREVIAKRFLKGEKLHFTDDDEDCDLRAFTSEEKKLLCTLLSDAQVAYDGFVNNGSSKDCQ